MDCSTGSRRPSIALVHHYLPPHEGGIEHVVEHLADSYDRQGFDPILVGWGDPVVASKLSRHRVVVLRGWNGLERLGVPVPLLGPLSTWRRLGDVSQECSAVHIHGLLYPSSALALLQSKRHHRSVIITEHAGTVPYSSAILRVVQKSAFLLMTALVRNCKVEIVVLNDRIANELGPRLGDRRTHIISNGVDTSLFRPAVADERSILRQKLQFNRPTILGVGRNVPKKHLELVLAGADYGSLADVLLVGAGTAAFRTSYCRAIESLPQSQLAELYRAVDVLVLPSQGEGLPMVVQEALASGLPVVMSDDPAVRAQLPEGPIAFVDPSNVIELQMAIRGFLQLSTSDRATLGRTARSEVAARFDWERTASQYLELLGLR